MTAARVDVAQHVAEELLRRADFHLHDRLQHYGVAHFHELAHTFDTGHLERHFGRVDRVSRTVNQRHLDVDHRVTADRAGLQRIAHTVFGGADVLPRHRTADDLVLEHDAGTALQRLHLELDNAVLATSTGLANEAALGFRGLRHRLAVSDLGPAHVGVDVELAQQAVDDHFQVKLAHAGDQRLTRLLFEREPGKSDPLRPASADPRPSCPGRTSTSARWRSRSLAPGT